MTQLRPVEVDMQRHRGGARRAIRLGVLGTGALPRRDAGGDGLMTSTLYTKLRRDS